MAESALKGRILLIEDTRDVSLVVTRLLEHMGLQVDACVSGEEGLLAARQVTYDVALIDLGLPGISGFETLRQLREEGHAMTCLALSGDSGRDSVARWAAIGGQGFVGKPVARRLLHRELARWLGPTIAGLAGGTAALQTRFITSMGVIYAELEAALAAEDLGQALHLAHRIKGTSRAFGAREIAQASGAVERVARDDGGQALTDAMANLSAAILRLEPEADTPKPTTVAKGVDPR
jgi:CheY-like chemotaxis protein/HPt (histidine-containing phosphotransfer) domain-containing protein